MKVSINSKACIGCAVCCNSCQEIFTFDDELGIAIVKSEKVPAELKEKCKEAAKNCPADAIEIKE
jgi:ferredoxin